MAVGLRLTTWDMSWMILQSAKKHLYSIDNEKKSGIIRERKGKKKMKTTSLNTIINSLPRASGLIWKITTNKGYVVKIDAASQNEAVWIAYNDYLIPRSTITKIENV